MWLRFLRGFASGAVVSIVTIVLLVFLFERYDIIVFQTDRLGQLRFFGAWLYDNLGLSAIAFIVLIICYLLAMRRLAHTLQQQSPLAEIQQAEQRIDTIVALTFGVGVIWTAVGLRGALTFALEGGAQAVDQSAAVVLDRLVNGGMLVALSSTIAGGVLGYSMRVARQVSFGKSLTRCYQRERDEQTRRFAELIASEIAAGISRRMKGGYSAGTAEPSIV